MEYEIKQMSLSDKSLEEVKDLLHITFPNRKEKFSIDYLRWQYVDNPRGQVIAYNAYDKEGKLAAHYAVIPIEMVIDGKVIEGVLSLNTATHPDHRGKRLFTILAEYTYKRSQELGRKFVIGVANANSTHGFLKNLGFYLIAPLEVKVGLGSPFKKSSYCEKNYIYYDETTLRWRLRCPHFSYSFKGNAIYGKINMPLFHTAVALIPDGMNVAKLGLKTTSACLNLYVGLGDRISNLFFKLPRFIKRSPFNLIFKDISNGELPQITSENIIFRLLDYDVA